MLLYSLASALGAVGAVGAVTDKSGNTRVQTFPNRLLPRCPVGFLVSINADSGAKQLLTNIKRVEVEYLSL